MESDDPLEIFWDNLLSREPARIQAAFESLDQNARFHILAHLKRMTSEEGWHPEQILSAQAALQVLDPTRRGQKD